MTTKNTHIQIRIDEKTKKSSRKIFKKLGLDFSSGIEIYLKAVIRDEGIPFDIDLEEGEGEEVGISNKVRQKKSESVLKKDVSRRGEVCEDDHEGVLKKVFGWGK